MNIVPRNKGKGDGSGGKVGGKRKGGLPTSNKKGKKKKKKEKVFFFLKTGGENAGRSRPQKKGKKNDREVFSAAKKGGKGGGERSDHLRQHGKLGPVNKGGEERGTNTTFLLPGKGKKGGEVLACKCSEGRGEEEGTRGKGEKKREKGGKGIAACC